MSDRMVAAATDNQQTLTVTVRFERAVTVAQAAAIEDALRTILGDTTKPAAQPAAVTPISKARDAASGRNAYATRYLAEGWAATSLSRKHYETLDGARRGLELLEERYGTLTVADVLVREVGPWTTYDGTPRDAHEYRLAIKGEGWSGPKIVVGGRRKLTALLRRNAGKPVTVTVEQRQIRSGWQVVEDRKAVA